MPLNVVVILQELNTCIWGNQTATFFDYFCKNKKRIFCFCLSLSICCFILLLFPSCLIFTLLSLWLCIWTWSSRHLMDLVCKHLCDDIHTDNIEKTYRNTHIYTVCGETGGWLHCQQLIWTPLSQLKSEQNANYVTSSILKYQEQPMTHIGSFCRFLKSVTALQDPVVLQMFTHW